MTKILPFLQKLVSSDKTAIASALVGLLTVLAAKFGFRMNGADTAYLSAGVMAFLGMFVHAHFVIHPGPPTPPQPPVTPTPPAAPQAPSATSS